MKKLKTYDNEQRLQFVDIQMTGFTQQYPSLDWDALNARIHLQKENGEMVTGLDATYLAWEAVGKGWLYGWLRWPIIRWFADQFYLFFAHNRYTISYLLTGKKRCEACMTRSEKEKSKQP
jgi:predicted DCC family thiol-disulfide oxidoreductase YuxK